MQPYSNEKMAFSEHFSELYKIIRVSAFGVVIISFFLSFLIDDILTNWLESLSLEAEEYSFSVYSPYDWIDTKWALLLIFSIAMILPYTTLKIRSFALPGLYLREKKWFTFSLFFSGVIIPVILYLIWFLAIPFLINYFDENSMVEGGENIVSARYDAVSIISLGIGFSWVLVIGVLTTLVLSMSRFFGMVVDNESRIRIRILLISFSLVLLSLPKTYDGLRIIISLLTVFFADSISRLTPIFEK
jgi:Sec-independent protein secretion pathway component TatC